MADRLGSHAAVPARLPDRLISSLHPRPPPSTHTPDIPGALAGRGPSARPHQLQVAGGDHLKAPQIGDRGMMLGEGGSVLQLQKRSLGLQIQLKRKQELRHRALAKSSTMHLPRGGPNRKETQLQSIGEQEAGTPLKQNVN